MKPFLIALALSLPMFAQNAYLPPVIHGQFLDQNGKPLNGGKIYTCVAGTSCPGNPLATWQDAGATITNANPVVLDYTGFAEIRLGSGAYKIVAQNSSGVQVWTEDNVTAGIQFEAAGTGAVVRSVTAKLADAVSVKDYGAKGDGSTDDTNAFNYTLNSGSGYVFAPAANYVINGTVTIPSFTTLELRPGTVTLGNSAHIVLSAGSRLTCPGGEGNTAIAIPSGYTGSDSVVHITGANSSVVGCYFQLPQPDSATRASYNQFNSAYVIHVDNVAAVSLLHNEISGAWNGISLDGQSGQTLIDDLRMASYNLGVHIDGPTDIVRLNNVHIWPFAGTANNQAVFFSASNIGIHTYRCDGLFLSGVFIITGTNLQIDTGTNASYPGPSEVYISHSGFENNGITQNSGTVSMADSYIGTDTLGTSALLMNGGTLTMSSSRVYTATAGSSSSTTPVIGIGNSTSNGTIFNATNCIFDVLGNDVIDVYAVTVGTSVSINNSKFNRVSGTYSNPLMLYDTGSRGTFSDNTFTDISGSGIAIKVTTDNRYDLHDNSVAGNSISLPSGHTVLLSNNNF